MSFKRVFVDGNVIIDLFDETRRNHKSSSKAIRNLLSSGTELITSSDLITTIYYVLSKIDKNKALEDVLRVLQIFSIIPFGTKEVRDAINLMKENNEFKDLEDTLQYVLAKKHGCDFILTNDRDFYSPDLKIYSSEEI